MADEVAIPPDPQVMERTYKNRVLAPNVQQPTGHCIAMLAIALAGICFLIVRVGEGIGLAETVVALLMLCAPLLCLRPPRLS